MRYQISVEDGEFLVSTEASFTLIDFLVFFFCLLAGMFTTLILWMFAAAVLVKVFTRNEFRFNTDRYELSQYLRIFNYFPVRRRTLSFGDVEHIRISNRQGDMLSGGGLTKKEWMIIELMTSSKPITIAKGDQDEVVEVYELYETLNMELGTWFRFREEFSH
ncbi:MAG: hypothetical protein AAFW89_08255 [Bacteroidota bacterium]